MRPDPNQSALSSRHADPRAVRAEHVRRQGHPPGFHVAEWLCREEAEWWTQMTDREARTAKVVPDDLRQELLVDLVSTGRLDIRRDGWRSWMRTRARWHAADMARRERRSWPATDRTREAPPAPPAPPVMFGPEATRLAAMGLNHDETRVMLYLAWGFGGSPGEFAADAGISGTKARQDKARGRRKILGYCGLTPGEQQAMAAAARCASTVDAARVIGMDPKQFTALLREAVDKIWTAYDDAGRRP